MKEYRVYQELPIVDSQAKKKVYLKANKEFTEDPAEAKIWKVLNFLQILFQLLIDFGVFHNLKIERK